MCFCCKIWKGLIFLRSYLHPHLDRANYKKVQISSLRKLVNMTWRKTWPKCPWNFLTNCLSKSPLSHDDSFCKSDLFRKKGDLSKWLVAFFHQHQTVDWPPKETFSTLIWNTWGCQFISPLSQTIFHLKTYQKIIILSKRVMSFNKPTTVNFSKPQHILLKRTHIHQCHTTFYVRAKSHFSLFSVLVQKDKKVIGQNSVDYRK